MNDFTQRARRITEDEKGPRRVWCAGIGAHSQGVAGLFLVVMLCCAVLVAAAAGQGKKQPPAKPIDLNQANVEELQQLPGIGPATAKAIVRFREKSGPFRRVEDLLAIRGITKARLEKLRPYVTVVLAPPTKGH